MAATAAVAALLLTAGCGGQQNTGNLPEQNGSRTGYALTFFRNVSDMEGKDDNVLVSPYSAGMALSMLAEGAEGETRDEIVTALGSSTFAGDILAADSLADVRSANSAWVRAGFGLRQEYVSRLEQDYGAMIAEKDFADRATVGDINRWCSDNTEGRIDGIVEQIAPDMVMFLVNALYFKAPWQFAFNEKNTSDRTFHGSAGDADVPMMSLSRSLGYASFPGGQLVELPYAGGRYSMLVALPAEGIDMKDAVACLTEDAYRSALDAMSRTDVSLTLPRFGFETDMILNGVLDRMGVRKAFSGNAEFGGISDSSICVDEVRQKCLIEVNEEGSEAAAVTSIGMRLTSASPGRRTEVMTVDRPFLFAIVDKTGDNILFMGRVMNLQ